MCLRKIQIRWMTTCGLVAALLIASGGPCIAQGQSSPTDNPPAPDVFDNSSSSSSSDSIMTCTTNIRKLGLLPVSKSWKEDNPIVYNKEPLPTGSCLGYQISADELAGSACSTSAPDSYILVEFWQLTSNSSSSSGNLSLSSSMSDSTSSGHVHDVRVLAAKGVQPWVNVGLDGHVKVTPPLRNTDTGDIAVGTFQDNDAVVYGRPLSRIFFPTNAVVVDMGERLDSKSWYITIASMPPGSPLPGFGIRAACVLPPGSSSSSSSIPSRIGSGLSAAAAAAGNDTEGVPCPVPVPGGKQCSGRGICRIDSVAQNIQSMSYCDCEPKFGSWGCQLPLQSLQINSPSPTVVTVGPGQWAFWEVTLPGARPAGVTSSGTLGDTTFAAAAAGLGPGLLGNEALSLTAVRVDANKGFGGNPLIFLKPFMTEDHNEPSLDARNNDLARDNDLSGNSDLVQYSDLRSFLLQLNKHYIFTRLPLQAIRGNSNSISIIYSMPRRWYVAVYNSNSSRLSEPVKLKLQVEYRDLNRQAMVCPFNCSNAGQCVDPITMQVSSWPFRNGMLGATMPVGGLSGSGGRTTGAPDPASVLTAIGPMQDISPVDAGFMCVCDSGYGGLTCEGQVQTLTVGNGEQKLGPETLNPGEWYFYVLTVDQGFNPQTQNLGIQWTVGTPSSPPSNYTNAFMSFDQGPVPRQLIGDRQVVFPVRKGMIPYAKLIPEGNPPLPLKVPGNQLAPGGSYVVSIFNNDYVIREPFQFTLGFFVTSDQQSFLHPYMSILLGVTAAVILCLAMTLCKRLVMRYGIFPWRWQQRRRQLAAAAAGGNAPGGSSLALVLMAQQRQQQQSNRGVPPEIYQTFPCRPYAAKDFQQRQQHVIQQQQQQQQQDVTTVSDQATTVPGQQPVLPVTAANAAHDEAVQNAVQANPAGSTTLRSMLTGLSGLLTQQGAAAAAAAAPQQQQQQQELLVMQSASSVQPAVLSSTPLSTAAAEAVPVHKDTKSAAGGTTDPEVHSAVHSLKDDELPSCTVCLCEYVADEMVRQLPCGHEFHQACIDQWMTNRGTCPICRAPLWHGACDAEDTESVNNSDNDSNNTAAIYVHHDMPSGGFRRSSSSSGGDERSAGNSNSGQAAAANGPTSLPAAAAAAEGRGAPRSGLWFGVNDQQPQRVRLQQQRQRRRRHQQQQQIVLAVQPDAVPAGTADNRRSSSLQQQQQQQQQSSGPIPAADDAV